MAPDLRPCCQQVLLDHYPVCDARREDPRLSAPCGCPAFQAIDGLFPPMTRPKEEVHTCE